MGRLDPAVAAARSAVRGALSDVGAGAPVVVACSGGADSTALLAATLFGARSAGWTVRAVVVDHGLLPDSAQVARAVAARARGLGCPQVEVVTVDVGGPGGPEAAARRARYGALTDVSRSHGDAPVLLGHTLDDQAETVLLGLARGSGARSLAGMAARRGRFRRPLLGLTREQTRQACRAEGLEVWDDPHNDDPRYARVRVRRDVLPALEAALGPGVARALARTAALTRDDADLLDALADDLRDDASRAPDRWDVATLAAAPAALRRRVLRVAAIAAGCPPGELFAVHVDAMERLVTAWHGQRGADLPGQVTASRRGDLLMFRTAPDAPAIRG